MMFSEFPSVSAVRMKREEQECAVCSLKGENVNVSVIEEGKP